MKNNVILVTMLLLFACNTSENNTVKLKQSEVMVMHDNAMEKMGDMAKLKKKLKSKIDVDSIKSEAISKAIFDLEDADKAMWDWMHNYHQEIVDTSSNEDAIKYLDGQHQDIKIVEQKINNSLKNGEAHL